MCYTITCQLLWEPLSVGEALPMPPADAAAQVAAYARVEGTQTEGLPRCGGEGGGGGGGGFQYPSALLPENSPLAPHSWPYEPGWQQRRWRSRCAFSHTAAAAGLTFITM
jgi:hypothetical protein